MKATRHLLALVALALAANTASAQFVKGNEAVKVMPDGTKKVETPPLPAATLGAPCPAAKAGCAGGGWKMLESPSGLVECTEVFARPGLGKLMVGATKQKDYTTLQSIMVVYALIIVVINLVTDIIYTYVDPRVRYG